MIRPNLRFDDPSATSDQVLEVVISVAARAADISLTDATLCLYTS